MEARSNDAAQEGQGHGVFESPPVPNDFPVFTPSQHEAMASPFPVFGAEEAASPYEPAPSPYEPAPSPYEPAPSPYEPAPSPYEPAPASPSTFTGFPPDDEQAQPSYAETPSYADAPPAATPPPAWQSFAPGGPPPAEESPAERNASGSWAFEIPEASTTSWSPFGGSGATEPPTDIPDAAPAGPREYTSVFDQPSAPPPAAEQPPHASQEPAYPPAPVEPAYPPAPPEPAYPPAEPAYPPAAPAYSAQFEPEPEPERAPQPDSYDDRSAGFAASGGAAAAATGVAAVAKASVPVASRVAPPSDAVPSPKPSGRVYGSSAGTGQLAGTTQNGVEPERSAHNPAQQQAPQQQAGWPQPDTSAAAGQGLATARAAVSVGRITPPEPGQPTGAASVQPGVYGRAVQPADYGPGEGEPGSAQPMAYGAAPLAPPGTRPPGGGPLGSPATAGALQQPGDAAQPGMPPSRTSGMPAYSDLLGPAQPTGGQTGEPAGSPNSISAQLGPQLSTDPDQGRFDSFKQETEPPAPTRGGTAKVLVMVIGACLLLIGLAFGALWAVGKLVGGGNSDSLAVGQCVQRKDNTAVIVDCGAAGSFKITKKVTDQKDCPNPQNDALTQGSEIYCLEPNP
jgi:hypothetical protein